MVSITEYVTCHGGVRRYHDNYDTHNIIDLYS